MTDACPFRTLGVAVAWPVDPAMVQRARLSVAARSHPDRAGSPLEREAFQAAMAEANTAAGVLLDPVGAAAALLRAMGAPPGEVPLPQAELLELLERREWFEELVGRDAGGAAEAMAWARTTQDRLAAAFGEAVDAARASSDWTRARQCLAAMKAHARMTDHAATKTG